MVRNMDWHLQTISNWKEFVQFVEDLKLHEEGNPAWYLRGQADAEWTLDPSLLRSLRRAQLTRKKALGIEFSALRQFTAQASLHLPPNIQVRDSWTIVTWWMMMQHYSCPTRLLDWTQSLYVAAYFAVEQLQETDGAIWLFPSSALDTLMEKKYGRFRDFDDSVYESADVRAVIPILGAQHNERSASQQGVYTVCTDIFGGHGEIIGETFQGQQHRLPLHKVIIPAQSKLDFLSRLRTMNITAGSLFPGTDGLGRAAGELIRLRVWRNTES